MSLYANSRRDDLIAKRDELSDLIAALDGVRANANDRDRLILTDAMLMILNDQVAVRAAITRIDETIRPIVPEIEDVSVVVLAQIA
jgi:hypothetical protein